MHQLFRDHIDSLPSQLQALVAMPPVRFCDLPKVVPDRGLYLFSENGRHLYVGRTNGIRKRLQNHCRLGGSHFPATFAFRIARKETGLLKATYKVAGSRKELVKDPVFGPAFVAAKARVNSMDIRFLEERDSVRQALLEIYVATALSTPFNDFDNH